MELQGHRGFGKLAPFNSIRGFHLAGLTGLQVNLCQKLLFLYQLTHNMTTDCSLNFKVNT